MGRRLSKDIFYCFSCSGRPTPYEQEAFQFTVPSSNVGDEDDDAEVPDGVPISEPNSGIYLDLQWVGSLRFVQGHDRNVVIAQSAETPPPLVHEEFVNLSGNGGVSLEESASYVNESNLDLSALGSSYSDPSAQGFETGDDSGIRSDESRIVPDEDLSMEQPSSLPFHTPPTSMGSQIMAGIVSEPEVIPEMEMILADNMEHDDE